MNDISLSSQSSRAAGVALLALTDGAELASAATILADAGLRTLISRSCREALRQLSAGQPRIVLCDQRLPDGDWKDLISWLSDSPEPPRVIVLAGDDPGFCAEAINLGAYNVLLRPLDADELRRVALIACGVVKLDNNAMRLAPGKAFTAAAGAGSFPMGAVRRN